jgi:hypothetical protein
MYPCAQIGRHYTLLRGKRQLLGHPNLFPSLLRRGLVDEHLMARQGGEH